MNHVIVACVDRPEGEGGAVSDWAAREARMRGLPLRVVRVPPVDGLEAAAMVVAGVPRTDAGAGPPPDTTARSVLQAAGCPVVLVPDGLRRTRSLWGSAEITLGVDAREPDRAAIDFAFQAALLRGVRLHVVHAWALPAGAAGLPFGIPEEDRAAWEDHEVQLLADAMRPWREKYPRVRVREDVLLFTPGQALVHNSAAGALVVAGRRSGGVPGAVVRELLERAECPVAVVPS